MAHGVTFACLDPKCEQCSRFWDEALGLASDEDEDVPEEEAPRYCGWCGCPLRYEMYCPICGR